MVNMRKGTHLHKTREGGKAMIVEREYKPQINYLTKISHLLFHFFTTGKNKKKKIHIKTYLYAGITS